MGACSPAGDSPQGVLASPRGRQGLRLQPRSLADPKEPAPHPPVVAICSVTLLHLHAANKRSRQTEINSIILCLIKMLMKTQIINTSNMIVSPREGSEDAGQKVRNSASKTLRVSWEKRGRVTGSSLVFCLSAC